MSGHPTKDSGSGLSPISATHRTQPLPEPHSSSEVVGLLDQTNPSTNGKPQDWPTPRAEKRACLDSHGKVPLRGSLNPDWVTQLQGYPDNYLEVEEWTEIV